VVLRTFDPVIADQLGLRSSIRRAFSLSALAAPAFVAAVLGEEVVETLRLGEAQLPLCRLDIPAGSPLVDRRPDEIERFSSCALIARADVAGRWDVAAPSGAPIAAGEQILVGGLQLDVRRLAADAGGWRSGGPGHRWRSAWSSWSVSWRRFARMRRRIGASSTDSSPGSIGSDRPQDPEHAQAWC
jgi:hypothetical protein